MQSFKQHLEESTKDLFASQYSQDPEHLAKLYDNHKNHYASAVIGQLADNPHTPPDILHQLSDHQFPSLRIRIARNSNTHIDTLSKLRNDKHSEVREHARLAMSKRI